MSSDISLRLEQVGKRYWKLQEQAMLLRSIVPLWRPTRTEFWALRDVDLTIERGETVGIIGRNGAGKTTLMRLLASVTQPSTGRVTIRGRVAPLISVGVGFHPEMSGRENVYVNGMLLGMTKREVVRRFDDIVAFAELEDFIDTPVKFYSSGMFMRLGFAVAISCDPEVLLVDEILAVGDIAFQLKCFERMREMQAGGATIVIVSHNMHAVRALCPRAVLMAGGRVAYDGDADAAIARQHELLTSAHADNGGVGSAVQVLDRELVGPDGPTSHVTPDDDVKYRAQLHFTRAVASPQMLFQVFAQDGTFVYELRTFNRTWRQFSAGETATIEIPFSPRLGGNTYRFVLHVLDHSGNEHLYTDSLGVLMYVPRRPGTVALADLDAAMTVDNEPLNTDPDLLLDARIRSASGAASGASGTER
jgi:ABC-type polysaccharide/polyol phosphate transport system ATPase subunit